MIWFQSQLPASEQQHEQCALLAANKMEFQLVGMNVYIAVTQIILIIITIMIIIITIIMIIIIIIIIIKITIMHSYVKVTK